MNKHRKEYMKKYREIHKEQIKVYSLKYKQRNKEKLKKQQKQFKKGMGWNNYGRGWNGKKEWNIDHIRPCASFDLSKENEQLKCFNYKNLQSLWAKENLNKSNRIKL